tara:strand:- start:1267 stop:1620 length:354 start_codon:yes stop_codon:yes gene_type:complete
MAHKVIKYRLTKDGQIPNYLVFGVSQTTSGMYAVIDNNTAFQNTPRNCVYLGISQDGANISESDGEITTQDDLTTYLTNASNGNNWKQYSSSGEESDFVPADAAATIWNTLTTLNGG